MCDRSRPQQQKQQQQLAPSSTKSGSSSSTTSSVYRIIVITKQTLAGIKVGKGGKVAAVLGKEEAGGAGYDFGPGVGVLSCQEQLAVVKQVHGGPMTQEFGIENLESVETWVRSLRPPADELKKWCLHHNDEGEEKSTESKDLFASAVQAQTETETEADGGDYVDTFFLAVAVKCCNNNTDTALASGSGYSLPSSRPLVVKESAPFVLATNTTTPKPPVLAAAAAAAAQAVTSIKSSFDVVGGTTLEYYWEHRTAFIGQVAVNPIHRGQSLAKKLALASKEMSDRVSANPELMPSHLTKNSAEKAAIPWVGPCKRLALFVVPPLKGDIDLQAVWSRCGFRPVVGYNFAFPTSNGRLDPMQIAVYRPEIPVASSKSKKPIPAAQAPGKIVGGGGTATNEAIAAGAATATTQEIEAAVVASYESPTELFSFVNEIMESILCECSTPEFQENFLRSELLRQAALLADDPVKIQVGNSATAHEGWVQGHVLHPPLPEDAIKLQAEREMLQRAEAALAGIQIPSSSEVSSSMTADDGSTFIFTDAAASSSSDGEFAAAATVSAAVAAEEFSAMDVNSATMAGSMTPVLPQVPPLAEAEAAALNGSTFAADSKKNSRKNNTDEEFSDKEQQQQQWQLPPQMGAGGAAAAAAVASAVAAVLADEQHQSSSHSSLAVKPTTAAAMVTTTVQQQQQQQLSSFLRTKTVSNNNNTIFGGTRIRVTQTAARMLSRFLLLK